MSDLALTTDAAPERIGTLLFATPPIDYVTSTAQQWADKGFAGFLRGDIMRGWQADVWADPDGKRVEGKDNELLARCAKMNGRLRDVGVSENFMVVPFSKPLPEWGDDEAWAQVVENFRQGARFARMAGFRGLALDDEYIEETFGLDQEMYDPWSDEYLRTAARKRGRELQAAMLAEYPDMVTLHLPESYSIMGELAKDLFLGCMDVLAEADAPGGMHVLPEWSYFQTDPWWIALYGYGLDRIYADDLAGMDAKLGDYWARRCGICLGQCPLGYLRFIRDETGKRLGYGGREEVFGNRILQAGEDKSGNYSADVFRATNAACRMVSRQYVWVFEPGPVWWRMTDDERVEFGGPSAATLPLTGDFDEYVSVLTAPSVVAEERYEAMHAAVEARGETSVLDGLGIPPCWWVVGPFPNRQGRGWKAVHVSETWPNLKMEINGTEYHGALGPTHWQRVDTPQTAYVDLSRLVAGGVEIQAYAATWVEAPEQIEAVIRFGCDDTGRIWMNGKLIHESNTERIGVPDEDTIRVTLPEGRTQLLLKIGNYRGGYGFYFRITDEAGAEIPSLTWVESL